MRNLKESGLFLAVILLSGVSYFFSAHYATMGWLMWIAPLPLLLYGFYRPLVLVVIAACLVGVLSSQAMAYAIIYGVVAFCYRRCSPYLSVFIFPLVWVVYEFFMQKQHLGNKMGSIAYTQLHFLPLIQIASLTGLLGITFVVTLLPSLLASIIVWRKNRSCVMWQCIYLVVIFVPILLFGFIRLHQPESSKTLRIGMAVVPANPNKAAMLIVKGYVEQIQQLAAKGAQIIVLPEKSISINEINQMVPEYEFEQVAKEANVIVVAGVTLLRGQSGQNVAWVFGQQGGLIATYVQQHIAQTHFTPGDSIVALMTKMGVVGIAIGQDMNFIQPALSYGAGAGIVLVPASNGAATSAVLSGLEYGYSVVRVAQSGGLSVSDDRGRMLVWKSVRSRTAQNLVMNVPLSVRGSLYAKTGDWFGWFCLLLLAILVIMTVKRHKPCKIS